MTNDKVQITQGKEEGKDRTQFRARVVSSNGRELFKSSEGYNNLADLLAITDRLFPNLMRETVGEGWE
jgi:hypothetical protein